MLKYITTSKQFPGREKTLAMVSMYPPPDAELFEELFGTLWAFKKPEPGKELMVIEVINIIPVVSIPPLPRGLPGMHFLCEKPGLDVVKMAGYEEEMDDDDNDNDYNT